MVVLRFAWVFVAYQCFAYAIFSEFIQADSGEFEPETGPVSASYAVCLTGVAQVTRHTFKFGAAFSGPPVDNTVGKLPQARVV